MAVRSSTNGRTTSAIGTLGSAAKQAAQSGEGDRNCPNMEAKKINSGVVRRMSLQ